MYSVQVQVEVLILAGEEEAEKGKGKREKGKDIKYKIKIKRIKRIGRGIEEGKALGLSRVLGHYFVECCKLWTLNSVFAGRGFRRLTDDIYMDEERALSAVPSVY